LSGRIVATARSTSASSPPPVDRKIGFPSDATYRCSGVFLRSPDANLNAVRSRVARNSALGRSNAAATKPMPSA
jgi:hypothetical protein